MEWCGWETDIYDGNLDLLDSATYDRCVNSVSKAKAYWLSPQVPVARRAEDSRPLRSAQHPWGVPEEGLDPPMTEAESKQMKKTNAMMQLAIDLADVGDMASALGVMQNPRNSLYWQVADILKLQQARAAARVGWKMADWDTCTMGGVRARKMRLLTSSDLLQETIDGHVCRHSHHPSEWTPVKLEGKMFWPSQEEQEQTAEFCWNAAVALSWELALRGQKMRIPGSPGTPVFEPLTTGNKVALLRLLCGRMAGRMLRDWGVPTLGLQLGMRIPACEQGLPPVVSVQDLIDDKEWHSKIKDRIVYFGGGSVCLGLRRSEWANPFVAGKDGGNAEVVLRWGQQFLAQGISQAVSQLKQLQDKVIVSDCGLGLPCHAKLAASLFQHYCVKIPAGRPGP